MSGGAKKGGRGAVIVCAFESNFVNRSFLWNSIFEGAYARVSSELKFLNNIANRFLFPISELLKK